MSEKRTPPSGFRIEQAMSAAMAVRQHLLNEDPDLASDEAAIRDTLDGETDVYDVVRRMARFTLDSEAMADAAKSRMDKLAARKARYERRAQMGRGAVFAMLDALGDRKLVDSEFTATIGQGPRAVLITDETALPDDYIKVTRTPLKTEIAKCLRAGDTVPGAELANGTPTLSLKAT